MNKQTYKAIEHAKKVATQIQNALANDAILATLMELAEAAECDYGNKSDKWQDSENGTEEYARIENLNDIVSDFESLRDTLRNIINKAEEIENDAPEGSFN